MEGENKKGFGFGTLGFILGIFVVVLSIIWVFSRCGVSEDEAPVEDITWVG